MPSPYRESDDTPAAALPELEWRRRVAGSARWGALLVLGNLALFVANHWLPARFALAIVVVWSALGAGVAVATWRLTARRPSARVGLGGWLLRITLPAFLAVVGLLLLGMHLEIAGYVTGALLVVAALAHSNRFNRPHSGRQPFWLVYVGATTFVFSLLDSLHSPWGMGLEFRLAVLFFAASCFEALRHQLLPTDYYWWFDDHTETPGEWVALLVYRDQQAEVLRIEEKLPFASEEKAVQWLKEDGYVPAERALTERLVDSVPPDVLPVPRRRKRLRAAATSQEPRIRVASDASDDTPDEAADELDDSTPLDEPEPPRAVAVHDPRDPRP